MTLLFVDFDGVLHGMPRLGQPYGNHHARMFGYLDPLAQQLLGFPGVRIVVSSSWRHEYTLDELRALLGPLGTRVVGTTGRGAYGSRYEEIRAAAYKQGPWIAVDDDIEGWGERDLPRLVACDPFQGLGEDGKLEELADKLARASEIHEAIEQGTEDLA